MEDAMLLGQLRTKLMVKDSNGDVGFYELNVDLDVPAFEQQRDARGFIISMLARSVVEQIFLTGVPAEQWYFEFSDEFVQKTGWVKRLDFDGSSL